LQNLLDTREELATVEERNRLARDLHDSVKQQVFATTMQLGAAKALMQTDPSSALEHIAEAEKLAKQSQQELTILIQELRPAALSDKGLAEALRLYVADWSQQTKIKGEVRVQGEQILQLELEQAVFRIVQEALSNVARHSEAQNVEVYLAWESRSISLIIQDDGIGLPDDVELEPGVGLQSMQERVEGLNGRFQLSSQPQKGVTVTAVIPLPV
jgi:NarL family two-component system sensor histidine kinase LiaS